MLIIMKRAASLLTALFGFYRVTILFLRGKDMSVIIFGVFKFAVFPPVFPAA